MTTKQNLNHVNPPYPMPFVRVELVVLTLVQETLHVMLSHRAEEPYKNRWGLPGGVLRIDLDASLESAAQRVARERLGRELSTIDQVATVGSADRDPRAPWALSVVYVGLMSPDMEKTPGKRVKALEWRPVDGVCSVPALAFDHAHLIELAVAQIRQDVRDLRYPSGSMPERFTLPELQAFSESVLGVGLDKVTFRRRVDAAQLLAPVPGEMRGGAHRPAQVYRFK